MTELISEKFLKELDELSQREKLELLDSLIHRLNFERRLAALTPKQIEHMENRFLSSSQLDRLNECSTKKQREKVIEEYARIKYFRKCMWSDYLNGVSDEPPLSA